MDADEVAARRWLIACAAVGVAMVALFPGDYFEDAGIHFLRARWMWVHPWMGVDVWDRPLFTVLYSLPANVPLSGFAAYLVAKLTTVAIALGAAWVTWKLARAYGLERPALVIPLMWLQPCVFLMSGQTSPEMLFALILATVLWLRHRGHLVAGLTTASFLTLIRPEGLLLLPVWAWWGATDPRAPRSAVGRAGVILALMVAPALWWYLAAQITTDPLFLIHNWPALFKPVSVALVGGGAQNDAARWGEILGVVLVVPFLVGVWGALRRRETAFATALLLVFVIAHLYAGGSGVFGWAPIPSEYVCVAPLIALVVLSGWNVLTRGLAAIAVRRVLVGVAALLLVFAAVADFAFADAIPTARDWRPIADVATRFAAHPRPVTKFIWSQSFSDVLLARDPMDNPLRFGDREHAVASFGTAASGTLVLWDAQVGPPSYHVSGADIAKMGFVTMYHAAYALPGWLPSDANSSALAGARALIRIPADSVRHEEMWLLYRP